LALPFSMESGAVNAQFTECAMSVTGQYILLDSDERSANLTANHTYTLQIQREKDIKLAQKLGQLQPFLAVFRTGMHGPTCVFWANLTPLSLQRLGRPG
jgi:hypothetical protein